MTHFHRKTIMASNFLVGARGGVLPCIPNQPCQSIYQIVNLNTNRQTTTHFSPVIPYSKANKQNKISVKNKSIESFKSIKISLYQCWTNNFNIKFRKGCLWFIRRRCLGINTKYQKEMSFFFVFCWFLVDLFPIDSSICKKKTKKSLMSWKANESWYKPNKLRGKIEKKKENWNRKWTEAKQICI